MSEARFEVRAPRLFTGRVIIALTLYGLLVSIPLLASMVVVSVRELSGWTFLIPLLAVLGSTFILPFGFGNPLIVRLVRSLPLPPVPAAGRFIVQLTLTPRLCSGWRALFEDADDIGWLEVSDEALTFIGDSVTLAVPWTNVSGVRLQSSGWRGLFAYGSHIVVETTGLAQLSSLHFAERSSWALPASRRHARAIYSALTARAKSPAPALKPSA